MNEPHEHTKTEDLPPVDTDWSGSDEDTLAPRYDTSQLPTIGRYRIIKTLGEGGFGRVYLAHDDELDRPVAIKVPRKDRLTDVADVEEYLTEARTLASLDHPSIVPVFDVGRTNDGLCFVVSKYVEGSDLTALIKANRPSHRQTAKFVVIVAEALHYAHTQGLVHRDIKPANILLDTQERPYVADFGLALKEADFGKGPGFAGTPAYMSPEQARGEGHRVDGRSDIFSLGVVFYELLTGKKPFRGDSIREVLDHISSVEARPPRQIEDRIPRELERICLKSLSKRTTDRYTTAQDLADDLRHFLEKTVEDTTTPHGETLAASAEARANLNDFVSSDEPPIKIVPKGLRSFDAHDADFFLELLPGARDRDGLPDSLRFWKTRIEETDTDNTFSVGLIYGPSGCGKSSLVKAGLLPRLSDDVISVYIEATPEETESRLLHGLQKRCHTVEENLTLKETVAALRRGPGIPVGKKVLIVLDQFEQWLHATKEEENSELVQALRQCDGGRVQCIVMVRDDFWMAVTRFMRELDLRLLEGQNSAAVDLFPIRHAEKVLAAFGRAFGALPDDSSKTSKEQKQFLNQSVAGLAEEGKVICVRLALFSDMMKGKSWTPTTLKEVGGTKGIGSTFLEETFSSSTASPEHRYHQKAARAVLKALLPESGTDIKGELKSYDELLEASGYAHRPKDFEDLIRILDSEIRLITPTDPEVMEDEENAVSKAELGRKYYQLTHDYLVHSLRDWLTRKQKETRRGRAELRLAERSASWNAKPENRHLPSLLEWASIRTLTEKQKWTGSQRKMMRKAGRVISLRSVLAGLGMMFVVIAGLFIAGQVEERQNANYAKALVESLSAANTADVEDLVGEIREYRRWTFPLLREIVANEDSTPTAKLHASLALVKDDPSQVDFLFQQLGNAEVEDVPVIVTFLKPYGDALYKRLWDAIERGSSNERIRAAAALADFDPDHERWIQNRENIVTALVSAPVFESKQWIELLRPAGSVLADPLEQRFQDRSTERDAERPVVAAALADYLGDDPQSLVALILLAENEREFQPFLKAISKHEQTAVPDLRLFLGQSPPEIAEEYERDAFWKKQANAAICLLELGKLEPVWPLFQQTPNPSLRSFIIDRFARLGSGYEILTSQIKQETNAASRYALILALGQFDVGNMSSQKKQELVEQVATLYKNDPDSGVHSAAGWVLRNWQQNQVVSEIDAELKNLPPKQGRHWFVNSQGLTFAVVNGPVEFVMRSYEKKRITLSHRFAVATLEVTVRQFKAFRNAYNPETQIARQPDSPANDVSWYDAVAYCNWLSAQEGIPQDQWCYEPNDQGEYAEGMKIPADYLQRTGYRLPTEEEWEFVCRASTTSTYSFGEPEELLARYAWYFENSEHHLWPVGTKLPNGLGAFDMHGNAYEWCHGLIEGESGQSDVVVNESGRRVLRGGAFGNLAGEVSSAFRYGLQPDYRENSFSFRPARTLQQD